MLGLQDIISDIFTVGAVNTAHPGFTSHLSDTSSASHSSDDESVTTLGAQRASPALIPCPSLDPMQDFVELKGDGCVASDRCMRGGLARFSGRPVMVIGCAKGHTPGDMQVCFYANTTAELLALEHSPLLTSLLTDRN